MTRSLALLLACLFPVLATAKPVSTWLMVALHFEGDEVVHSRIFGEIPTEAKCKELQAQLAKEASEAKVEIWSACVELAREPAPLGDPKTKQRT